MYKNNRGKYGQEVRNYVCDLTVWKNCQKMIESQQNSQSPLKQKNKQSKTSNQKLSKNDYQWL